MFSMVLNDLFLVGPTLGCFFNFWVLAGFDWFHEVLISLILAGFLLVLISGAQTVSGLWFWSLALVGSDVLDAHGLG